MKKEFEKAEIEVIIFEGKDDIVTDSTGSIGADDVVEGEINWG